MGFAFRNECIDSCLRKCRCEDELRDPYGGPLNGSARSRIVIEPRSYIPGKPAKCEEVVRQHDAVGREDEKPWWRTTSGTIPLHRTRNDERDRETYEKHEPTVTSPYQWRDGLGHIRVFGM